MSTLYFAVLTASYLGGAIPFALILGKLKGVDVRCHGSGNIGATNLVRVAGRKWGVLCFLLDFGKGALPVLLVLLFFAPAEMPMLAELSALAAVVGHVWPVYLGFRGGKGMATTLGALTVLSPWALLGAVFLWFVVFQVWRYVSLASIVAAIVLPVGDLMVAWLVADRPVEAFRVILLTGLALFVIWRHWENIKRLLAGTENRFVREGTVK